MRVTLKEIADKKGITWHAIRKRKLKEGWQACGTRLVNHKPAEEFETDNLPDDIKALFENLGSQDVADGCGRVTVPGDPSVASLDQERLRDSPPDQLAPAQPASAPGHSLMPFPGPQLPTVQLTSGEIVSTTTGEVLNIGSAIKPLSCEEIESEIYAAAPEWAKRKADKYLQLLRVVSGLKGTALRQFIAEWNTQNPDLKTSYDSVLEARKKYAGQGVSGLLAQYGHSVGSSKVQDEHFKYFKDAYLKEGAPSTKSCWTRSLGYARSLDQNARPETFPSPSAFQRRLEREIPESSIYLARYGHDAWNRKFASYIDRDYSQIKPGEVIVSDHAQIDVATMLPNGRPCFPWVTAWRDFKTSKWLSWILHPEAPNSDFIFQSFYYSVKEHGLPTDVYVDNGRDYRARDFAGGRKRIKVRMDEKKSTSMLALLGITPHFALPYGAQSKPIERDFLKNKEWFSKHLPGYRGGDVTERPEILDVEIKQGKILPWDEFVQLVDRYVIEVLNKMPSSGKVLQGRSPDEAWETERHETRKVSSDALKLFCMRTSHECSIGRNGVRDSQLQCTYWAEWMYGVKNTKVYLRRDIKVYQTAWVFDASNDEFLGKAELVGAVSAIAKTNIEKAALTAAMAHKNRDRKITKAYIDRRSSSSPSETVDYLAAGVAAVNQARGYEVVGKKKVKIVRMANTAMDKVVRQDREMQRTGTDYSIFEYENSELEDDRPTRPEKPLAMFHEDLKEIEEQYQKDLDKYNVDMQAYNAAVEKNVIFAGPLVMDLDRQRVKSGDTIVDLLPMEFRLLHVFMSNRGKVFGRAEIKDVISRSGVSMELRAIDVHVTRLRTKLQKVGAERYVLTKRGSGYFFSEED